MSAIKQWLPLFSTQFLGVLNDNVLKNAIIFISIYWLAEENQDYVIPIASALLVLPFLLFSPLAGKWAQSYSKSKIFVWAKLAEIPIMLLGVAGFFFQSIQLVMTAMLLMGLQSAIYSPSKYGLIRDVGGLEGVSFGVGTMELLTFVGALLGQVSAGVISDLPEYKTLVICLVMVSLAILGWITSKQIKATETMPVPTNDTVNPFKYIYDSFRWSQSVKGLNYTVLGLGGFWLVASLLQMNIYRHAPEYYHMSNTETSIVMALIAIGIGVGCWVAGLISKNRVEIGMVPIGGLGLSTCLILFATIDLGPTPFIVLLVIAAFFSGFYKVPLNAWIQERVEGRKLGNILAYNNMVAFAFILLAAALFGYVSTSFGTQAVFTVIAIVSCGMTFVTLINIPAMMVRFLADLLSKLYYRYEIIGRENIPKKSGALLVANHQSFLDPLIIVAAVPRMLRFVMGKEFYDHPAVHWLVKRLNVIPISARLDKDKLEQFNKVCHDQINQGHVVCIFPEGQISRIGHLLEFKKGVEHIAKRITAPIIPIQIEGIKGTPFSFETGSSSPIIKWTAFRKKITIAIGKPMSSSSSAFTIRQKVQELNAQTFENRIKDTHTLPYFFKRIVDRYPTKVFLINELEKPLTYQEVWAKVKTLSNYWITQETHADRIGILLPTPSHAILANLSLTMSGKIAINLSPEWTTDELKEVVDQCEIKKIIIPSEGHLALDGIAPIPIDKIFNQLSKNPVKTIPRLFTKESVCTLLIEKNKDSRFEIVSVTHKNILASIKGLMQSHTLKETDQILNILPYHTLYGYGFNLWLPTLLGMQIICPQNNLTSHWADLIEKYRINVLLANHETVEALERSAPEIWKNLNYVLTGQETISDSLKAKLKESVGLHISESLSIHKAGCLIAVNTPDYNVVDTGGRELNQLGTQKYSFGRAIPGLAIKTVDPNNLSITKEAQEPGLLLIKGAAIGKPVNIDTSWSDGWLVTDLIGSIDCHGFVRLENR